MSDYITPDEFHGRDGVDDWRLVSDGATAFFRTASLAESARFVHAIGKLSGIDEHTPDIDVRAGGVTVRLLSRSDDWYGPSERDVDVARRVSAVAREQGLLADPSAVQSVLIIVESPGPSEVMPFWQALLGYERRADSPDEDLVDPGDRGPAFWFEELDEPHEGRPGGIHIAVWIPQEEAEARVAAALAAGGRMVRDEFAPTWWTMADAAGNEADVATTTGRG
jgi:4a-hydroxytetrahydrobiopterin dehydratase